MVSKMTENNLGESIAPLCDGISCECPDSVVRIIPLDNLNNVHLCCCCYELEQKEDEKNRRKGKPITFRSIPFETYPTLIPELERQTSTIEQDIHEAKEREIFGETLDQPIPDDLWDMIK